MDRIFAVYDAKAAAFLRPFFERSVGTATRAFEVVVKDETHQFGMHPEDYSLHQLGEWDEFTGAIKTHEPLHIIGALEIASQHKESNRA